MKKRIASFMLAIVILLSTLAAGTVVARAESAFVTSDECIRVLKIEEGFSQTPYWDYTQYTVGYGTRCPDDMVDYYTENGITEEEAEQLLRNHLNVVERDINKRIIDKYGLTLSQNQFDALVLFSYNCGTAWAFDTSGTFHQAVASGATGNDMIRAFALWCSAGNQIKTFLLRRRLCEANMYLNGVYANTPPANYGYVLYDANGGYTSPRSQGYDTDLTAAPFPTPTLSGYSFQGWFTEKTGGTKVTVLNADTKNKTLYAQWADAEGNPPPETGATMENPVTVTVTASDVNLRQGPGTNHTVVGTAHKGEQYVITETASGSGYVWGKFDGGWIALEFTDYDNVVSGGAQEPTEPEETAPEETEPETEPETTEPPETEPEETEPETTAPEETEPEETEPPKTSVTGTVNVQDWLRVRSGPGTGYDIVEFLKPKQKVEILEQKMVGSQQWGKITSGWICMDYVILDSDSSSGESSGDQSGSGVTGTVTTSDLRIRSGPGTNYSILGYMQTGNRVTITEQKTNGSMIWGKTSSGWISLDYVRLDSASGGASDAPSEELTGTVNVQDWLRIRTGPGTSYSVAGYLGPKERVTITERRTVGSTVWGKISGGWVSMDYVILDSESSSGSGDTSTDAPAQSNTKTIVADCLRIRSGAGTENTIVGYLYYGAKVEILETATAADGTLWGKISTGWISMDYAK